MKPNGRYLDETPMLHDRKFFHEMLGTNVQATIRKPHCFMADGGTWNAWRKAQVTKGNPIAPCPVVVGGGVPHQVPNLASVCAACKVPRTSPPERSSFMVADP